MSGSLGNRDNDDARIVATFRPQEWVGDTAVYTGEYYLFDVTAYCLAKPLAELLDLTDHSYEADDLWYAHPISTERPHNGPFEVEVVQSLRTYLLVAGACSVS